jgi:IPT/TIG domain
MLAWFDPGAPLLRVMLVSALALLLSGGSTCSAIFAFKSCEDSVAQPQVTSLSPSTISRDAESVLLAVNGSNFTPQSQIMWDGSALPTAFVDSGLVETTITQQTFALFGVTSGNTVQISVMSPGLAAVSDCPVNGSSAALMLVID